MRIRTTITIVITAAAGAVGLTASPAAADLSCRPAYSAPTQSGNEVSVEGFLVCSDPDDPRNLSPIGVALQRQFMSSWVTVATGNGEAVYTCTGTSTRTYRNSRLPSKLVTLNCS